MSSATPEKIIVGCESCHAQLRLDVKYQGKKIKCPKCQGIVAVPASAVAPPPAAPPRTAAPASTLRPPRSETRRHTAAAAAPEGERPMMNRAPTAAQNDPFSRKTVTGSQPLPHVESPGGERRRRGGRGGSGTGTSTRRHGADTGRGGRGGRGGRDKDRSATRRATAARGGPGGRAGNPGNKNDNLPMILGISGGSLLLIIVLAVVMLGGNGDTGSPDQVASGDTRGEDQVTETVVDRFNNDWENAEELTQRMRVLTRYAPERQRNSLLDSSWQTRFQTVRREIPSAFDDRSLSERDRIRAWLDAAKWAQELEEEELTADYAERVLELEENNSEAREILGFKQWRLPTDDVVEDATIWGWLADFEQYEGQWMRPERYNEIQSEFEEAMSAVVERFDEWERNPFMRRAYQMERSILSDRILRQFADRFELRVIEPFVIIFGTEGGAGDLWVDERYEAYKEVLEPFWEMWVEICREYNLTSRKSDCSFELPQPFAFLSMATEEGFHEYLRAVDPESDPPRGARAWYMPINELVYFWEGPGDLDIQTVMHEALHQIMERYTTGHDNMFGYRNAAFVEGAAEYYSGWDRGGPGGSLRFKRWTLQSRHDSMVRVRQWLDADEGVIRWNITDDDWVLFQVPALISMSLGMARGWAGAQIFNDLQTSNSYRNNFNAMIMIPQNAFPLMYAYAWAWVYFLNEYYPEEYARYVQNFMNEGMADAEAFLHAFDIEYDEREFRDIGRLMDGAGRDRDRNRMLEDRIWERMEWLKRNPRIIEINRQYVDFLGRRLDQGIDSDTRHGTNPLDEEVEEEDMEDWDDNDDSNEMRWRLPWPREFNERRSRNDADNAPRKPGFEDVRRRVDYRLPWPEALR